MKIEPMDFEALKKEAAMRMRGQPQGKGIGTVLRPMLKEFLESMPEGEMDAHMAQECSLRNSPTEPVLGSGTLSWRSLCGMWK